jgi:hypothetical protein
VCVVVVGVVGQGVGGGGGPWVAVFFGFGFGFEIYIREGGWDSSSPEKTLHRVIRKRRISFRATLFVRCMCTDSEYLQGPSPRNTFFLYLFVFYSHNPLTRVVSSTNTTTPKNCDQTQGSPPPVVALYDAWPLW